SVSRHLLAAAVAHPARADQGRNDQTQGRRPRHPFERAERRAARTAMTVHPRSRTVVAAALAIAAWLTLTAGASQQDATAPPPSPTPAPPPQQQAPPAGAPTTPGQTFKAGVDLVSLNVTVNESGTLRYATDLEAEDFQVFEDGVKQDVSYFT